MFLRCKHWRFRFALPSSPSRLARPASNLAFYSGAITAPTDMLKAVKKSIEAASLQTLPCADNLSPAKFLGRRPPRRPLSRQISHLVVTRWRFV